MISWKVADIVIMIFKYITGNNSFYTPAAKLLACECHKTSLIRSQHWFSGLITSGKSYHRRQCWARCISSWGVTRPPCVFLSTAVFQLDSCSVLRKPLIYRLLAGQKSIFVYFLFIWNTHVLLIDMYSMYCRYWPPWNVLVSNSVKHISYY